MWKSRARPCLQIATGQHQTLWTFGTSGPFFFKTVYEFNRTSSYRFTPTAAQHGTGFVSEELVVKAFFVDLLAKALLFAFWELSHQGVNL